MASRGNKSDRMLMMKGGGSLDETERSHTIGRSELRKA